ncbi:MAG: outer membrane protein assembly factor BamD [Flavobacteriaceae bacterium]|nr:outer membrane protein assembly factor BamD [Flavobacteriaceae bacterium]
MIKNKFYFFVLGVLALAMSSCGEYQKVLSKGTPQQQYKMATDLYDAQKYSKAIRLFEKMAPFYKGKPQMERIRYMASRSYFNTKQYQLSAYHFDKFAKSYPKSSKAEEAHFLSAYSYYLLSPVYSLDQEDTRKAITEMQRFISKYPDSKRIKEANKCISELTLKLEKKAFEIAKLYYYTEDYIAAVASFDHFLKEYLGSSYKEKAMYYKCKSGYELGMNSIFSKKETRIENAISYCKRFVKIFPKSTYNKEITELKTELETVLEKITATKE